MAHRLYLLALLLLAPACALDPGEAIADAASDSDALADHCGGIMLQEVNESVEAGTCRRVMLVEGEGYAYTSGDLCAVAEQQPTCVVASAGQTIYEFRERFRSMTMRTTTVAIEPGGSCPLSCE